MIGLYLVAPLGCHFDDTVIHEPCLQFGEHGLVITSITFPLTNTAVSTLGTSISDEATGSASYDVVCVTIEFHRTNILEEKINQLKDPALVIHPLKHKYIDEKGSDADSL